MKQRKRPSKNANTQNLPVIGSGCNKSKVRAPILAFIVFFLIVNLFSVFEVREKEERFNPHWENVTESAEITSNFEMEQRIEMHSKIKMLEFTFTQKEYQQISGEFQLVFEKNGNVAVQTVIMDSSHHDGALFQKQFYVPKWCEGPFTVRIKGIDGSIGSSWSLVLTEQQQYGALYINGQLTQANVIIGSTGSYTPAVFYQRIVVFVLLLLVTVYACYFLMYKKDEYCGWRVCLFAVSMNFLSLCLRYPFASFKTALHVEEASNFFHQTLLQGVAGSFLIDDVGYWPLVQRLIGYLAVYVFDLRVNAILFMSLSGIAIIAVSCAYISAPWYRSYWNDDVRFVFALTLGLSCWIVNTDTVRFPNMAYAAIILLCLNFILDYKKLTKLQYSGVLATSLFCLSKGDYTILFPIGIIVLILSVKKSRRLAVYSFLITLASGLQAIFIYMHMGIWGNSPGNFQTQIGTMMTNGIYYTCQTLLTVLGVTLSPGANGVAYNTLALALIATIIWLCIKKYEQHRRTSITVLVLLLAEFGANAFHVLALSIFKEKVNWVFACGVEVSRRNAFPLILAILIFVMLTVLIFEGRARTNAALILSGFILLQSLNQSGGELTAGTYAAVNWQKSASILKNSSYAMPIGGTRFIKKDSDILYIGTEEAVDESEWNFTFGSKPIQLLDAKTVSVREVRLENEDDVQNRKITSIFAHKLYYARCANISAVLLDANSQEVARSTDSTLREEFWLSFHFSSPVTGVTKIVFMDNDTGAYIDVRPQIYLVIESEGAKTNE